MRSDQPTYRPAVDGLRALAVSAVIAFHLGHLSGGYLGVDAFFVISGWLITWRLLGGSSPATLDGRPPHIDLRGFWSARARRLMPASLAVVAVVAIGWPLLGLASPAVHHDVIWAALWSSNWGTIGRHADYWSAFAAPSPLTHFWSLAIEEQFYLVWPVLLLGVLALRAGRRRPRAAVAVLAGVLATASIAYLVLGYRAADPTATYMSTFARAHSLLIGAVAATVTRPLADGRLRGGRTARRLAPVAGAGALAMVLLASDGAPWLFRWGFPAFAVAMAVVVVAAADGWGTRVLAHPAARWVSDRSYGLYLWHWPVIVLATPARTGVHGPVLDACRIVASVGLADASFRWLERPIRSRRRLTGQRAPLTAATALAGILAVTVLVGPSVAAGSRPVAASTVTLPPPPPPPASAAAAAPAAGPAPTSATGGTTAATAPFVDPSLRGAARPTTGSFVGGVGGSRPTALVASEAPAPATTSAAGVAPVTHPGPLRVLVAGDSTAVHLATDLIAFAAAHPDDLVAGSAAFPGCGLTAGSDGRRHAFTNAQGGHELIDLSGCVLEWQSVLARAAGAEQLDAVLVDIGPWDGADIHLADGRVVSIADPLGRAMVEDAYRSFASAVRAAGVRLVWVEPADIRLQWGAVDDPMNAPGRWAALRQVVDSLGVTTVDLPGWLRRTGNDGPSGRPDGVHLDPAVDAAFVAQAIVPALDGLRNAG